MRCHARLDVLDRAWVCSPGELNGLGCLAFIDVVRSGLSDRWEDFLGDPPSERL